jgi:hypothetical protein
MKTCPKCHKDHSMNGRFCSPKCANSRTRPEEVKTKIKESVLKRYSEQGSKVKGKPGWKHTETDKELKRQITLEFWDRKGRKQRTEKELKAINTMHVMKYRARKFDATPPDANLELIKKIYKACPEGYEVDHIIALAEGGLHHENNLQYLPAMENRRKNRTQNYDRSLAIYWQDVL